MTITTRPDWNGNEAVHSFDDVQLALEHMKSNPCYEIVPDGPLRPYGDVDYKVSPDMTETEFHKKDFEIYFVLAEFFKDYQVTIFTASDYNYRKISHRWVIPDCYVKSRAHAKEFAKDLYSRLELPEGVTGDLSVYSKNRKMRTFWTSKPNENRPFYMLQGEEEDHIISFIPTNARLLDFEIQENQEPVKPVCSDYEQSYITQLCDCVSVEAWTKYESCQSLIFTLLSLGASTDIIHTYCGKATNYNYRWVNDYIRRYNPSNNRHSIGTLKYFAKQGDPDKYNSLARDELYRSQMGKHMFEEMTHLTEDEHTHQNWCDENGFLKTLPQCKTLAVKSHLGTGKTRRCIEACTPSPFNPQAEKVLVVSCRQTFTTHICAELKGFVDYRSIKDTKITNDKLVIQLQSIWKCTEMESRDLILLDEVESILSSLTPNKTHKKYVETYQAFEKLIRSAKRVIALDAFLTDRTIEFLKTLRGDCEIVINPTLPYKKTADLLNERDFYDSVRKNLQRTKRITTIWGAKNKAKSFHSVLQNVDNVLYTGDSDPKIKETHLADVDKYWATHQMVGYTATITVGINYNGPSFDMAAMYATPWSCSSRDYIQALHRARKLNDNHILVYISKDPRPCAFEAGIDEQEEQFKHQTERVKKFLESIGQTTTDYSLLPQWLHRVLMWNMNETITNYKHFDECIKGYFRLCGISYGEDPQETIRDKTKKTSVHIDVLDVKNIEYETAQIYARNRNVLTDEQRYELEKFFLVQKVTKVDEFIWTAWLDNKKQVERAYSVYNNDPKDLIKNKIIDLVPRDAERLKIFQDLKLDWDTQITIPVDKMPKIDLEVFGVRLRSEKDTPEQYCRDLSKSIKQWCGIETKIERRQIKKNGKHEYEYTFKYEPIDQIFQYIARPLDIAEIFGDE